MNLPQILTIVLTLCLVNTAPAMSELKEISLGINYVGGQLRYDFNNRHSLEMRFLTGQEATEDGQVSSQVLGLRGYKFRNTTNPYNFFIGTELAFINSTQEGTTYKASGPAIGGFAGIEFRARQKWSLGFDIGPYLLLLEETTQNVPKTSLEFIANAFFNFYVF